MTNLQEISTFVQPYMKSCMRANDSVPPQQLPSGRCAAPAAGGQDAQGRQQV